MIKKIIIFTLSLTSFVHTLIASRVNDKTAIVQEQGHLYTVALYQRYHSNHFWNSNGKRRAAFNTFEKDDYQIYAEYGLTRRDTLSIKESWAKIEESVNGSSSGFADIEIGWKHYLGEIKNSIFSSEIVAIVPVNTEHRPGLRYGRYGGEVNLLISKGFFFLKKPGCCDFRLGYRGYEGFPSDQIRVDAVGSFELFPRTTLFIGGYLEYGLFNGHSVTDQSFFCFHSNYRLFKGRLELLFKLYKGASLIVGYQRNVWGNNVGTGGGWYGGAQVQF